MGSLPGTEKGIVTISILAGCGVPGPAGSPLPLAADGEVEREGASLEPVRISGDGSDGQGQARKPV